MKTKISLVLIAGLALLQLGMNNTGSENLVVRMQLKHYPAEMKRIHKMDLDVAGIDFKNKQVEVVVDSDQAQKLKDLGFNIIKIKSKASLAGPDKDYQNPAKVENTLKNYAALYPTLAEVKSIGKSLEGRDIWAIRITKDVATPNASKPRILFNGMHHAREVMSTEVPLDIIETLLTQYGKDEKVTHWVDANEIWVVPMFNVDGNTKVWSEQNMWRKNARPPYGVDINRNYPYAWNSCHGSSSSPGAQDYHGESAGSEPETQVMVNFVKEIRPVFDISFHSYSEIVIYPFGCEGQHTPTKEVVEKIGAELAGKIVTDDGKGHYEPGTAPELLYSVDGGDIDWMYHEASVIPYVVEVNSMSQGFQPSYSKWRNSTVKRVRPGWQLLLEKLDGSSIRGSVLAADGSPIKGASVHIERVDGDKFVQDMPVPARGYFTVILPAGKFKVTLAGPGIQSQNSTVTVGSSPVIVNAKL